MKKIIETLQALIPFFEPYPPFVKIMVAIGILYAAILLIILVFVPKHEMPKFTINGILPTCIIKRMPPMKVSGESIEIKEYGIYLILEISTEKQSLNLRHISLEGELFLNGNECLMVLAEDNKALSQIFKEAEEKRPYYHIKWVTSSPNPSKFDANQTALTIFTLAEPTINQGRSFVASIGAKDVRGNYIGYKSPYQKPKWESTHPNIQEFLETKIADNKPYFSNIREDYINGNIKWYLKIGKQEIVIPPEKIKPLKIEYLGQKDDITEMSLEKIYYRKWY